MNKKTGSAIDLGALGIVYGELLPKTTEMICSLLPAKKELNDTKKKACTAQDGDAK